MMLVLLFAASVIAGIFNISAAGGSFLMLPLLIFYGLPPTVANGTNRISLLFQNWLGVYSFKKRDVWDLKTNVKLVIPAILGSILGAYYSSIMPDNQFKKIISVLMIIFVFVSLFSGRNTKKISFRIKSYPIVFLIFLLIGFYGGFIQAGVGLLLIAGIKLATGYDLVKTNAVKTFIIASYTIVAIIIFALKGKIDWHVAAVVATGQGIGGYLGAKLAVEKGEKYIKILIFIAIIFMALKLMFS